MPSSAHFSILVSACMSVCQRYAGTPFISKYTCLLIVSRRSTGTGLICAPGLRGTCQRRACHPSSLPGVVRPRSTCRCYNKNLRETTFAKSCWRPALLLVKSSLHRLSYTAFISGLMDNRTSLSTSGHHWIMLTGQCPQNEGNLRAQTILVTWTHTTRGASSIERSACRQTVCLRWYWDCWMILSNVCKTSFEQHFARPRCLRE